MTVWDEGLPTLIIGLPGLQDKATMFRAAETWSLINKDGKKVFHKDYVLESANPSPYTLVGMLIYDLTPKSGMVSTSKSGMVSTRPFCLSFILWHSVTTILAARR